MHGIRILFLCLPSNYRKHQQTNIHFCYVAHTDANPSWPELRLTIGIQPLPDFFSRCEWGSLTDFAMSRHFPVALAVSGPPSLSSTSGAATVSGHSGGGRGRNLQPGGREAMHIRRAHEMPTRRNLSRTVLLFQRCGLCGRELYTSPYASHCMQQCVPRRSCFAPVRPRARLGLAAR